MQRYQASLLTLTLCAGLVAALAGCGGGDGAAQPDRFAAERLAGPVEPAKPDSQVLWTEIDRRQHSQAPMNRNLVVQDADHWIALWNQHAPGEPVPKIDFSSQTVIAVFGVGGSNLCYHSAITAITREGGKLVVVRTDSGPGNTKIACLTSISFPAHIVAVDRTDAPVEFVVKQHGL